MLAGHGNGASRGRHVAKRLQEVGRRQQTLAINARCVRGSLSQYTTPMASGEHVALPSAISTKGKTSCATLCSVRANDVRPHSSLSFLPRCSVNSGTLQTGNRIRLTLGVTTIRANTRPFSPPSVSKSAICATCRSITLIELVRERETRQNSHPVTTYQRLMVLGCCLLRG